MKTPLAETIRWLIEKNGDKYIIVDKQKGDSLELSDLDNLRSLLAITMRAER